MTTSSTSSLAPGAASRLSMGRQLVLALYWLGISFLWGSFVAVVLPVLLVPEHPGLGNPQLVPTDLKNSALSLLETIGLVFPMTIQPAAGAWSDRLRTRWGRRRPLILGGALGGVLALGLCAAAPGFWFLLGAYCLLQISMNVSQGGYQGLLPDTVPGHQRGAASGLVGVGTLLGQVLGIVVAGILAARLAALVTAAVVGLTALATVVFIREQPTSAAAPARRQRGVGEPPLPRRWGAALHGYLAEFRGYPDFCWVVASRFLTYTGLACFQRFALNFLRDSYRDYHVLGHDLGSAKAATSALFAVVILCGLVATYPAVRASERTGRRAIVVAASLLGAVGSLSFFAATTLDAVLICAVPIGLAFGMLVSVDWAFMADLAPRSRSGKFLGFSNIATAGSQAFAPFLLGPVIDGLDRNGGTGGYRVLFAVSAVFFVLGAVALSRLRATRIDEADEPTATVHVYVAGPATPTRSAVHTPASPGLAVSPADRWAAPGSRSGPRAAVASP